MSKPPSVTSLDPSELARWPRRVRVREDFESVVDAALIACQIVTFLEFPSAQREELIRGAWLELVARQPWLEER